jgi:hypothetical protein
VAVSGQVCRDRVGDRQEWCDRITTEPAGVPGVYGRLVARLPRHLGRGGQQHPGGLVVAVAVEVLEVEERHIDVVNVAGVKA